MKQFGKSTVSFLCVIWVGAFLPSCSAPKVDFSAIQRPERHAELDAYDVFVGSWTWTAKMLNACEADCDWTGTATWEWTLDKRCLQGRLSAKSAHAQFDSTGIWSWNPNTRRYGWWLFNSWGYPQQGTATYDASEKSWVMKYRSIGLDGSASHGRYQMKVVDNDTLDWRMEEWADASHLIKKAEMTGTYMRKK